MSITNVLTLERNDTETVHAFIHKFWGRNLLIMRVCFSGDFAIIIRFAYFFIGEYSWWSGFLTEEVNRAIARRGAEFCWMSKTVVAVATAVITSNYFTNWTYRRRLEARVKMLDQFLCCFTSTSGATIHIASFSMPARTRIWIITYSWKADVVKTNKLCTLGCFSFGCIVFSAVLGNNLRSFYCAESVSST